MMVAARTILLGLALALWAAPAAPTTVVAEVPWQDLAANLKVHKVVANVDRTSFDAAVAGYPRSETGGNYPVKAGRYFLWKIVGLFTSDQRVDLIRLESFVMPCRPSKTDFATDVICDLNGALLVRSGGRTRVIDLSISRTVGRFFDPAKPDYATVIAAEIKDPIDLAVTRVRADLQSAGIL